MVALPKILLSLALLVLIGGGVFAWQKYQLPGEPAVPADKAKDVQKDTTKQEQGLPRFEDFKVAETFTGSPAVPNFARNPGFLMFITRITEGAKAGPNFADHYTIIEWGCGAGCQSGVIVDAATGNIYGTLPVSELGREFRRDSNLLVVNSPESVQEAYGNAIPEWVSAEYYTWENNVFTKRITLSAEQIKAVFPFDETTAGWQTYRGEVFTFKYPEDLGLQSVVLHTVPPFVAFENGDPAPPCEKEVVFNETKYCVRATQEGAAGSTYTNYAYMTVRDEKLLLLVFTIRRPTDCNIYADESMEQTCREEVRQFDPTKLADQIFSTLRLSTP